VLAATSAAASSPEAAAAALVSVASFVVDAETTHWTSSSSYTSNKHMTMSKTS